MKMEMRLRVQLVDREADDEDAEEDKKEEEENQEQKDDLDYQERVSLLLSETVI